MQKKAYPCINISGELNRATRPKQPLCSIGFNMLVCPVVLLSRRFCYLPSRPKHLRQSPRIPPNLPTSQTAPKKPPTRVPKPPSNLANIFRRCRNIHLCFLFVGAVGCNNSEKQLFAVLEQLALCSLWPAICAYPEEALLLAFSKHIALVSLVYLM